MDASAIPAGFPIPFANSAGSGYIRAIPVASQIGITNGAASLTDGFPPDTFIAVGAGGIPPFGQDFNGILYEISAAVQGLQTGYIPAWNSTFCTDIGGYPEGAVLASTTAGAFWLNQADNNTTNPDGGSAANWINFFPQSITGNAGTATKLVTPRTIALTGAVSGSANFDGSGDISISTTLATPTESLTDPGYVQWPNGLIEQWGTVPLSVANPNFHSTSIVFPEAFPNAVFDIQVTMIIGPPVNAMAGWIVGGSISTSGFTYEVDNFGGGSGTLTGLKWSAKGK